MSSWLASIACAGLLLAAGADASTAPPAAHYFDNPRFSGARLSPDARFVALRTGGSGKRDQLAVLDLANREMQVIASFPNDDIGDIEWVDRERLVFNLADKQRAAGALHRSPGLYAIDRDGSKLRQLVDRRNQRAVFTGGTAGSRSQLLFWHHFLQPQQGLQDSGHVYVFSEDPEDPDHAVELRRVSTHSGAAYTFPRPPKIQRWLLDHKGEPRLAASAEGNTQTIHYREPGSARWRVLSRLEAGKPNAYNPLAFGPDGTLYAVAHGGKNNSSLHTVDLNSGKVSPAPVVVTTGYDFSGSLVTDQNKLLGVHVLTDAQSTVWFDARMKKVQAALDAKLPDSVNLISVAPRPETPWVLVEAFSDVLPRTAMGFNTDTGDLFTIGASRPDIVAADMGRQELVHYKARDGRDIPAWLTLPRGAGKAARPMVVLVHGGPYVRGAAWEWNAEAQFLATRGYVVLQPEFRGSTGFGRNHFNAGLKQWGLAMQDDIADGASWAIAQGYADARRICIAGSSYGGYSALMGLIRDPALFKCGINWSGLTDLDLLYTGNWHAGSDIPDAFVKYGLPQLVGDPVRDAAQLKAASPLLQAARITQPLLLAYGGSDSRVPAVHGERLRDAVSRHNRHVQFVLYPAEGHGWHLPETRIDFWGRVETFLERHIGTP